MESACPEKSFPQLPKSGTHTRRTPTNRAPAKPSPVHTGGTGSPSATAVAPDMPDTPRPCRSSPQAPSDSEGILPPSPHTTYWGYLSQGDTHLTPFVSIRRIRRLRTSPKCRLPFPSKRGVTGQLIAAFTARPPSPEYPFSPVPAMVSMIPSGRILRMTLAGHSQTTTPPLASAAIPVMLRNTPRLAPARPTVSFRPPPY